MIFMSDSQEKSFGNKQFFFVKKKSEMKSPLAQFLRKNGSLEEKAGMEARGNCA